MLKKLLTAHSDAEKHVINCITSCIKFMHQNYDIEWYRVNRTYQTILQEFKAKTEPTHVPEEVFARIASQVLKINNLTQTRLYDKLKICLNDPQENT